jgi:geranylgeranyl diphosphate synthase, type II
VLVDVQLKRKAYAARVDERLSEILPPESQLPGPLSQAMRYACLAPGKRLRPILCLAAAEAVGADSASVLDAACALEMLHAFSLVHDDLPAIDNDDLRRGRPTCHIRFGEATAILAGDGLFALAFQTILDGPGIAASRLQAASILARASTLLVRGETADVLAEGKPTDSETLEFIHRCKTGELISASVQIGAILANASETDLGHLRCYGDRIGLAFQIVDDILNETSTADQLGKAVGSDRERGKATFPNLYGLDAARQRAGQLATEALAELTHLSGDPSVLADLANFVVDRVH